MCGLFVFICREGLAMPNAILGRLQIACNCSGKMALFDFPGPVWQASQSLPSA